MGYTIIYQWMGVYLSLPLSLYRSSRRNAVLMHLNSGNRLRLVMPPILFFSLQLPFTQLAYIIFPTAVANGIISGAFAFCGFSRHFVKLDAS